MSDDLEHRLGLVARGVQRMADAFGAIEAHLAALPTTDHLAAIADRMERLETRVARAVDERPETGVAVPDLRALDRLVEGVISLRDDLLVAIREMRADTTAALEQVLTDQATRLGRLHDVIEATRAAPTPARFDDLQRALDDVRDQLRSVHGEVVTGAAQLRTDLIADAAELRERLVDAVASAPPPGDERFAAIDAAIAALRDDLAIERLESSMRDMAEDTSGLRNDVRRSFERVLLSITNTEQALTGEVRAIDHRLGGMADDLRLVRSMRDGLEALAAGVDAVRQLASRSATSAQMIDLTRDLSAVLTEIEAARSQVLAVDRQVGMAQAIDVSPGADLPGAPESPDVQDVHESVEELERTVTEGIDQLGKRIEELATQTTAPDEDPIVRRLRSLATSARQLGMGMAEDIKARRGSKGRR